MSDSLYDAEMLYEDISKYIYEEIFNMEYRDVDLEVSYDFTGESVDY